MRIKEIKRKGDNIYTVTFIKRRLFRKDKEIIRDVYSNGISFKYCSNDEILVNYSCSLNNLVKHLNGYEPLTINN